MTADNVGGVWTYSLDLATTLKDDGVEVHLAIMGPPLAQDARDELARRGLSWDFRESILEWMPEPWPDVAAAGRWLQDVAQAVEPDLVHLNDYAHAAIDWGVPVIVVAHSCVLSWWRAVKGCDAPPGGWDVYHSVVQAGLERADLVVAPTRAMRAALAAHYSFSTPTMVVPNGTLASADRNSAKEPFVVAVGRVWDEAKNITAVERGALRLPWPVVVAGAGATGDGGAPPTVRRLGPLPHQDVTRLLARAAIYAEPARYEPFGLAALEAGASGCALVLGDIASLREVWDDAALYVDPDDDSALASALTALIEDPDRRARLGERARKRALRFPTRAMSSLYAEAYRRLLQDGRRAAKGAVA